MSDLFQNAPKTSSDDYTASDIEVLEGLEPVRRRPGMYIGGTDDSAYHHLASEILDNSMDEAVAGHADWIEFELLEDGSLSVRDNGRGIPVDSHPKFPEISALEVILTTLHSGGKFSGKSYQTSGGLHGVGISVVNALSDTMWIEVARNKTLYRQSYSRGKALGPIENLGPVHNRRGTTVCFHPDPEIFGDKIRFKPSWLLQMVRSKAYLYSGVEIRWKCAESLIRSGSDVPTEKTFHYPNGLLDYLDHTLQGRQCLTPVPFHGKINLPEDNGRVEFAIAWPQDGDGFCNSYCNTIITPLGGSHENGLRNALTRGLKSYGEMTGNKKSSSITADDIIGGASILLSVFIKDPQFQGQTKEKLASPAATRWVDIAVKDHFDHWLSNDPSGSTALLEHMIEKAQERLRKKEDRALARKSATQKLRLPGKLTDCSRNSAEDTELFIVEGDSAGGSAKQARNRETQAVLPLRGKILNVVSATQDKIRANQEIQDLIQAMGSGKGDDFNIDTLRYERIIIMTDADVDGAHIAALLITFFYDQMRPLITQGRLFLAMPPLYRLASGNVSAYAMDDAHKEELMNTTFKGKSKVDISRFKGLGEMPAPQLKETTMAPATRSLIRVILPHEEKTFDGDDDLSQAGVAKRADVLVEDLMGRNADARFRFIQDNAAFVTEIDV